MPTQRIPAVGRLAALFCSLLALAPAPVAAQFVFARLIPDAPALEANGASDQVDVSPDGRVIVFASIATNWVPGCLTGCTIVATDLVTDAIDILSRTSAGATLNGNSSAPVVSTGGRYVAFTTQANNLDVGVATSGSQIVRKDRTTGALELVSASAAGAPASGSASGQARDPSISGDGRYVAFRSDANNLVPGDAGGIEDVFVKDMLGGAIEAVSRDLGGAFTSAGVVGQGAHSISADGRFVLFQSSAANLVAGVGGGTIRVFLRDRTLGTTELVSRSGSDEPANSQSDVGAISPSGRFVSFRSFASNLGPAGVSGVYVRDRVAGTTTAVPRPTVDASPANGCRESDVSDAGTVILSCFFPLPVKDQVFLHVPGAAGTPFLVSSDVNDVRGNELSGSSVAIDASGLSMAFESLADNLVAGDGNASSDVFVLVSRALLDGLFSDGFEE
jgi:Tol biopolymer transport system component